MSISYGLEALTVMPWIKYNLKMIFLPGGKFAKCQKSFNLNYKVFQWDLNTK